jgi:hypothetical protein
MDRVIGVADLLRLSLRISGRIEACQGIILGKSACRCYREGLRKPGFGRITAPAIAKIAAVRGSATASHRPNPEKEAWQR